MILRATLVVHDACNPRREQLLAWLRDKVELIEQTPPEKFSKRFRARLFASRRGPRGPYKPVRKPRSPRRRR